ncbi:hypothetical protein BGX28_004635 [Mortierella sp. GBA30]|nr:hypothetical protein BGX28_004635 [Mortierella sp. GBA30]
MYGSACERPDILELFCWMHNLIVVYGSAAERSIVLKGRLGDLLNAFPADLRMYLHWKGSYRGRQGEILIPKQLEKIVTGIFGFDTPPKRRHGHRQWLMAASGPGGSNGLVSTDFAERYNFPTDHNGMSLDGSGQTIAIVELGGGFRTSDLEIYFKEINIPLPSVTAVEVGACNDPGNPKLDREVMLNIEVAGAVVPKAKLVVYFAPNDGDKGFLDGTRAAIHDNSANRASFRSAGVDKRTSSPNSSAAPHCLYDSNYRVPPIEWLTPSILPTFKMGLEALISLTIKSK